MKNIFLLFILLPFLNSAQTLNFNQGNTYAVVVGISDYQNEDIPDLKFADKDALAFAGFLQSPAGGSLDEDHLKVLINDKATQAQFGAALDWLWEVAHENDKVIIYFSGHGDVERKSITQPGYLLCWDAPPNIYMGGGAFNVRDLNDVVSTISIQNKARVILITDACRAGKLSGSGIGGPQATAANLAKQYGNEIKILSCQPDEYSVEGKQWGGGRGAFSYHLLDALYGMADRDDNLQIDLKEVDRYLEDHVSTEVEPHQQLPMTVGNGREKLANVFPETLAQIIEGRKGQMQMYTATESRGIEEDVLAAADSNVVEMYMAFKESLTNKKFLEPEMACADFYYEKLSRESALKKLHSSMRRNYSAALQDDAQQVMNLWLTYDSGELTLSKKIQIDKYRFYPDYLKRAAELLGEDHYMYSVLKARALYFEAHMMHSHSWFEDKLLGEKVISKYREALQWQPDAPHVYFRMMAVFYSQMLEPDSAEYYAHRATELIPSWYLPYSYLGFLARGEDHERARRFLELADQVDSAAVRSSILHQIHWANYYSSIGGFQEAINIYQKVIQADSTNSKVYNSTNSRIYHQLGQAHLGLRQFEEVEKNYKKAIQFDSTNVYAYIDIGNLFFNQKRYEEAEQILKRAMQIDSTDIYPYNGLGWTYLSQNRFEDAEQIFKESMQIDSTSSYTINSLGRTYMAQERYEEAEQYFKKAIQFDSTNIHIHRNLGSVYVSQERYEEAEQCYKKSIQLDSTFIPNYNSLGAIYMNQKHFKKAEKLFRKAMSLDPQYPWAPYNMACLNSLQKDEKEAFVWLEKTLELKAIPFEKYQSDSELDNIRDMERFKVLMKKYFPEEVKE